MGLIYKLGNTIQSLPFPGNTNFSSTTSITLGLVVSMLLSLVQWHAYWFTQSASLAVIGTLQIIISCYLSLFLVLGVKQDRIKLQKIRFLSFFLGGFFISLACGYLFLDACLLLASPILQFSTGFWIASFTSLVGNILIVQILTIAKVIPFKVKTLQIPFFSIVIFSMLHLGTLVFVWGLDWAQLDAVIGLLETISLCLWGGVISLDAYWQMVELDKITYN